MRVGLPSFASALIVWAWAYVQAAPPEAGGIFPAGGQRGSQFTVAVEGKLEPWPVAAHCEAPGVVFSPVPDTPGSYRVEIAAGAPAGGCLVRFFNAEGVSTPRQFALGSAPEQNEAAAGVTNVAPEEWPIVINGRLAKPGEVDRFEIPLAAGERLVATLVSHALDAPLDPLLHLRGPGGEALAFNHDGTRTGLDPRLSFTAPRDGRYQLQVAAFAYPPQANVRFAGGATSIYRLALAREAPQVALPPPQPDAQTLELPVSVGGRIDEPSAVHRYSFGARKGDVLRLAICAARLGSWMDPVLAIEDAEGKELKRVDDSGAHPPDVDLEWTAPEDGEFVAAIGDLAGAAGADIFYRLDIEPLAPGFDGTATPNAVKLAAGDRASISVTVQRRAGFGEALEVTAEGLPAGVTAAPAAVDDKGVAQLEITAAADAPPASGPITVWLVAGGSGEPDVREACRFPVAGATTEHGKLLVNSSDLAWLTVTAAPE